MALHYSTQLFDVNTNSHLKMLNFMESTSYFDKSCGQQTAKFFNGFPQPFGFDDRASILEGKLLVLILRRAFVISNATTACVPYRSMINLRDIFVPLPCSRSLNARY